MRSIDKVVMLEALGWSRGGKENKYLPDDIIKIIRDFAFFDSRTEAYREHLIKEDIKMNKQRVLFHMMSTMNIQPKYGSDYCVACGECVQIWDILPEKIRCSCQFFSEEEIMELEYNRPDNYFWEEEEDAEREKERRRKNREFYKEFADEIYSIEDDQDDPYSDRKPNWDEGIKCSLYYEYHCDNYDYCDDGNSYFKF